MLRRLRTRRSSIAAALLLCLVTAAGSQALPSHADEGHDAACTAAVAQPHDESAHIFTSAQSTHDAHPLHCLVCHWARTFRPLGASLVHEAPRLELRAAFHQSDLPAPATVFPSQLTLRSPPSTTRVS